MRVWIPGCATGEEAYSLAMPVARAHGQNDWRSESSTCLRPISMRLPSPPPVWGRYPETLLKGLSPERFERFFRGSQGSFVVSKEIRDLCTFSAHNLIRDPPFSRMDLVSWSKFADSIWKQACRRRSSRPSIILYCRAAFSCWAVLIHRTARRLVRTARQRGPYYSSAARVKARRSICIYRTLTWRCSVRFSKRRNCRR